jgi:nucleotide-binding universal stress UspA family protein
MFRKILVGVDGSEHGFKAAGVAGELARQMKSDIVMVVVSFEEVPRYLGDSHLQDLIAARMTQADQVIRQAVETLGAVPGEMRTEVLEGPPAEAILAIADSREVDLIVMGTRGLGRLAGLLLGSQSQKVAAHASCPVLLVR